MSLAPKREFKPRKVNVEVYVGEVDVDVDVSMLDDSDLIAEARFRGLSVAEPDDGPLAEAAQRIRLGDAEGALIIIEREFPALSGITAAFNRGRS